ncbi:MAG: hypothetical protein LUQ50_15840 [Methanospirillum sp.]|nr:hypothetical protein [Methanospirillum sp.]
MSRNNLIEGSSLIQASRNQWSGFHPSANLKPVPITTNEDHRDSDNANTGIRHLSSDRQKRIRC